MTGGVVLVLGETGRNFGAGMSGGIAYVLDEDDRLASQCHIEVQGDVSAIDEADVARIQALLDEHVRRTGSPKARAILDAWRSADGQVAPRFVKLVPHEYQRALAAQQHATSPQGTPPPDDRQKRSLTMVTREVAHG
jgi:glutamate synthase (NADPH/NADH) large chain